MRRSLGLGAARPFQNKGPHAGKERHRFRQDGEVPVVMVGSKRSPQTGPDEASGLETALQAERQARLQAEHALQQAQASLRALQTKLVHAELSYQDSLASERQAREQVEAAAREAVAKLTVQAAAVTASPDRSLAPPPPRVARASQTATKAEAKPVQWWAPGWDAG